MSNFGAPVGAGLPEYLRLALEHAVSAAVNDEIERRAQEAAVAVRRAAQEQAVNITADLMRQFDVASMGDNVTVTLVMRAAR